MCLVFSCLSLGDNRRLARCASLFLRTGQLHTASPLSIELDGSSGTRDWVPIIAHVAGTMRPLRLAIECSILWSPDSLSPIWRITSLQRLALTHVASVKMAGLSGLTALTDLTVRLGTNHSTELTVAGCTGLVRLHLGCAVQMNLDRFTTLTRLESLTLEDPSWSGAGMWEPLERLPRLSELGILCTTARNFLPVLPALPVTLALRRVVLHGDFDFADGRTVAMRPGLRSLEVKRWNSTGMLYARDMTQLESLALSFPDLLRSPRNPGTLAAFGLLVRLRSLTLRGARIRDLSGLERLVALTELDLRLCSDLVALAGLVASVPLRSLSLSHCEMLGDVRALSLVTGLESLVIDECAALERPLEISVATAATICALTRLSRLQLDDIHNTPLLRPRLRRLAFGTDACPID